MLDANLKQQLSAYMANITMPVELLLSLEDGPKSRELEELAQDIAALSDKVSLARTDDDARRPSMLIRRVGTDIGVRFAGLPMGHEFTSLVLALLQVGGHPSKAAQDVIEQVKALDGDYVFETYFSLSCQNCPDVVQALNLMSVLNPRIKHVAIDGALFQSEVMDRKVMAVPMVFLNGEVFGQGRMDLEQIVAKLDSGAEARAAEKIKAKDAFDVLVVGGGPAGAAAAVYAARKGIRTGIAAERFGGQVLDTMGIENFISVSHTEGPKLVAQLEQHVKDYDVDIMNLQRAEKLIPAASEGGLLRALLAVDLDGADAGEVFLDQIAQLGQRFLLPPLLFHHAAAEQAHRHARAGRGVDLLALHRVPDRLAGVLRRPDRRIARRRQIGALDLLVAEPVGDVLGAVQAAGYGIADVSTREPDLEDVFLNLTQAA